MNMQKLKSLLPIIAVVVTSVALLIGILIKKGPEEGDQTAEVVKAGIQVAINAIDLAEGAATVEKPPQFHPCMVATGSKAGLQIALSNVDVIDAEVSNPDGKLHLRGGPIDFSRCRGMAGKPDPWPPAVPDPTMVNMIETGVPLAVGVAKSFIEPKIPPSGEGCIKGRVALAVLDSASQVVTTTVLDGAQGKEATQIPEFDVSYSGCGLTLPTPESAPAEAPADQPNP